MILSKRYPQNLLFRKPVAGAAVLFFLVYAFVIIYRPPDVHEARSFGFLLTVFLYCFTISLFVLIFCIILKKVPFFSNKREWNFGKELLFDIVILCGIGISVYFAGFLIEEPGQRWNISTFADSVKTSFLLGFIPVLFFSAVNIRYLNSPDTISDYKPTGLGGGISEQEQGIKIISKVKKNELVFYPNQFVYAESMGNYVVFNLWIDQKPKAVTVRISISEVERQLAFVPFFMRIHRAFIVNLNRVIIKKGNSLGYLLTLSGTNDLIPVSRQNTGDFDRKMEVV